MKFFKQNYINFVYTRTKNEHTFFDISLFKKHFLGEQTIFYHAQIKFEILTMVTMVKTNCYRKTHKMIDITIHFIKVVILGKFILVI